jgi:hypothetical protein
VRVTFTLPAPSGSRYAPEAFTLGKQVAVTFPGPPPVTGSGTLLGAVVVDDGRAAELTADVPDRSELGFSLAVRIGRPPGGVLIHLDGRVSETLDIRRRDPRVAAEMIRSGYAGLGIPPEIAEAMIEETMKP